MIPALAVGLLFVFALSYVLGRRERTRLGVLTLDEVLVEEKVPGKAAEKVAEKAERTEAVLVGMRRFRLRHRQGRCPDREFRCRRPR